MEKSLRMGVKFSLNPEKQKQIPENLKFNEDFAEKGYHYIF